MKTTVVGLGQHYAGDDAVALAVIAQLGSLVGDETVVRALREPSQLIELLGEGGRVIVVDALDDAAHAGRVEVRDLSALDSSCPGSLSSHGLGVAQAVELARALHGSRGATDVRFLTISVDPRAPRAASGMRDGLSPGAAAAAAQATARVLELLEAPSAGCRGGDDA